MFFLDRARNSNFQKKRNGEVYTQFNFDLYIASQRRHVFMPLNSVQSIVYSLSKNAAAFSLVFLVNEGLKSVGIQEAWIQHAWGILLFWVFTDLLITNNDLKIAQEKYDEIKFNHKCLQELYSEERRLHGKDMITLAKHTASIQDLTTTIEDMNYSNISQRNNQSDFTPMSISASLPTIDCSLEDSPLSQNHICTVRVPKLSSKSQSNSMNSVMSGNDNEATTPESMSPRKRAFMSTKSYSFHVVRPKSQ